MDNFVTDLGAVYDDDVRVLSVSGGGAVDSSSDAGDREARPNSASVGALSESDEVVEVAKEVGIELFCTPDRSAFATIKVKEHRETWQLDSRELRQRIEREFYFRHRRTPGPQAMRRALSCLEAAAKYDGTEHPVFTRVAEVNGTLYLDLGDEYWRAVAITPEGWDIVAEPTVKFTRADGMRALPVPAREGHINELRPFVNVDSDDDFHLLVAWLLGALRPTGPFAILGLQGEQGSAKSTTARMLRLLVDPSTAPLRRTPRNERDLMISAQNGWVLSFDNLSSLPEWLSDALCSLATGIGLSTRLLRTNDHEKIFNAARPLILNGIDGVAERADLADRALLVSLPAIPAQSRRDEATLWAAFEKTAPRILGALLDGVSTALRNFESVKLTNAPRMADFARWVTGAERAFGWPPETFMAAYNRNRKQAVDAMLDTDVVAVAVRQFLAGIPDGLWEGSATDLQLKLRDISPELVARGGDWPRAPNALTRRLGRIAPALGKIGIAYESLERRGKVGKRGLRLQFAGAQNTVGGVSRLVNVGNDTVLRPPVSIRPSPNGNPEAQHGVSTSSARTSGAGGLSRSAADQVRLDRQLAKRSTAPGFVAAVDRADDADDLSAGIVETMPRTASTCAPQIHRDASSLSALAAAIRASGKVGLSVAATGPDPCSDRPSAIAIALPGGEIHVVDLHVTYDVAPVVEAVCQVLVVGHDVRVDLAHLANEFGILPGAIFDIKRACELLDRDRRNNEPFLDLAQTCRRTLGTDPPPGALRTVFTRPLAEDHIDDLAERVRLFLALDKVVRDEIQAHGLDDAAQFAFLQVLMDIKMFVGIN